jgi:membrane protease YdiL (CAAX protease family)
LTYVTQSRDGRREFWQRLIDIRRISPAWYAVTLFTAPTVTGLAALLDRLLGGVGAQPEALTRLVDRPWSIAWFVFFTLLFGPLPEEIGWRGYALNRLQARFGILRASLLLGAAWALWHLPLFLIGGTYQSSLGFGSLAFWLFMLGMVPQSVIMTWIYNHTRCSTLSAVLFHFSVNAVGELVALTERAEICQLLLWIAVAVAVVATWALWTPAGESHCPIKRRGRSW